MKCNKNKVETKHKYLNLKITKYAKKKKIKGLNCIFTSSRTINFALCMLCPVSIEACTTFLFFLKIKF